MSDAHTLLIKALRNHVAALEAEAYVPGAWSCPQCLFTLMQSSLNSETGEVRAMDKPGEKCPNCHTPMWRKTWKAYATDIATDAETQVTRAVHAEDKRDDYHRMANALASWAGDVCERVSAAMDGREEDHGELMEMITRYAEGGVRALLPPVKQSYPANEPGAPVTENRHDRT